MKRKFADQLNREIEITFPPLRIVSLVPSQTELLFDLGLEERVVGITKFCVHPEAWFRNKKRVGGTKSVDVSALRSLAPDLIIANKEENELQQIQALQEEFPVWISDVKRLEDALQMIHQIGTITDTIQLAEDLTAKIERSFFRLSPLEKRTCAYLIWYDPVMTINGDTFINDMLQRSGLINVFADRRDSRYPEISDEVLRSAAPEVLLLSSEPFPFSEKHVKHFSEILPRCRIELVDGEMFSWYGSRLEKAPSYFSKLLKL